MIAELCLALASCAPLPPAPAVTDAGLTAHAERAEARAFLEAYADARDLVDWVEALTAPPTTAVEALRLEVGTTRPAATSRPPTASEASVNGYPCGGDLPPCSILRCESGGNPTAENPSSSASGLWQIIDGTWNGYAGYRHAADAPAAVQNAKAAELYAGGAGASHWAQCR